MIDSHTSRLFRRFCDRSLPRSQWTHEAHLGVCWAALDTRQPATALAFLRDQIRSYNEATGGANTPTSGYHETLTAYFVHAVAELRADTIDEVLAAPRCRREAPLRHWSRDRLFSRQARATWVDPDLEPLTSWISR